MLEQRAGISEIAKAAGLTRQTVYRIRDEPGEAESALATWEARAGL
jgi:putative DNA-invertase from lambdoid prophage Rac